MNESMKLVSEFSCFKVHKLCIVMFIFLHLLIFSVFAFDIDFSDAKLELLDKVIQYGNENFPIISMLLVIFAGIFYMVLDFIDIPDEPWKNRLAYLRWNNPLPATRFEKIIENDGRIDLIRVKAKYGDYDTEPKSMNLYWYNIYKNLRKENKGIENIDLEYKFLRDFLFKNTVVTLLLILLFVYLSLEIKTYLLYLVGLVIFEILIILKTQNIGHKLVKQVLAEASVS
jgi:hypothetical protein